MSRTSKTKLFMLVFLVAVGGGWVANIIKLVHSELWPATGMVIARVAGIFVPPLGALLGYF